MAEPVSFEKAMEKLEKIVEELESGEVRLEEALKRYEEGVKLARFCQATLGNAEKKIEILTRTLDGTLKAEAFDPEEAPEDNPAKGTPGGKSSRKKDARHDTGDEGDLLL